MEPTTPTTPEFNPNQSISDQEVFDHITQAFTNFSKERVDVLVKWMHHHAFDDILSIIEHMAIDPEKNMDSMTKYKSGKQMHDLHVNTSQQIKLLAHWFRQTSIDIQGIPSKATWMNLTKAEFDLWRINTDFRSGSPITDPVSPMKSPSHSTSPKSFSTTSAASQSQLDLTAFKKGTKRDAMAYETYKDERYYDTFWRTFKTTAKAQGLSNVLDFRYKPPTNDTYATELFQEQQIFLYSVLVRIIQTDQGRAYVREHEHDEDARAVLQKLHTLHTKSDLAKREVLRLTNYISNLRLDDTWRGSSRQFLLHFQDKLPLLDNLVDLSDRIPDHTRMTFLMQAVEKVPDLRRVKILDNVVNTKSGAKSLCYQSYFSILIDAAYDHDQVTQSSATGRRRSVKQHEQHETQHDIEGSLQEDNAYQINNTNVQDDNTASPKASLPRDLWFKLPEDARKVIVEYNKNVQAPTPSPRNVQQHSLDIDPEPDPDPGQDVFDDLDNLTYPQDDSDPATHLIHQAMTSTDLNHPASDLSNVLSNAASKTSKKVSFKQKEHKQKIHMAQYMFSRKSTYTGNQLIDRGANGGLAGADMRILSKTGRNITTVGIDNHELTGLPIVTCAAKFETNDGPIVGIFNEYAYYGKGQSIHAPCQLEHYGLSVDERSVKVDGKQRITTLDGRALPLWIKDGLAYIQYLGVPSDDDMDRSAKVDGKQCITILGGRAIPLHSKNGLSYIHSLGIPSDDDMDTLPQIIFTSPDIWDPGVLDHLHPASSPDSASNWQQVNTDGSMTHHPYDNDNYGEYTDRDVCNLTHLLDLPYDHGSDTPSFSSPLIGDSCSKLYHQDHNMRIEKRYPTVKKMPYVIINVSGHLPLQILNGRPPDFSQPLFFLLCDKVFSCTESYAPYLCPDASSGEESLPNKPNDRQADTVFICSKGEDPSAQMPTIKNCDKIFGQAFPYKPAEGNGEQQQACIIQHVNLEQDAFKQEGCIKKYIFCKHNSNIDKKVISCSQLVEYNGQDNQEQATEDVVFQFRDVVIHQGPSSSNNNPDYKGSRWNELVDWETGEMIFEPPTPTITIVYGKKHDLLNELGWKHFKHFVKISECLIQAAKQQSRINQRSLFVKYKFGYPHVPQTHKEAIVLDKQHGKNKWQDTTDFGPSQIQSLKTLKDHDQVQVHLGKMLDAQEEYHNKIQVYRVKHDDRCKALLVTCEHFTKEPVEAICPCAISFCNFHTTIYLGPLNDMDIWRACIGNACNLKALAGEKTLIVARQEVKELCHTLVTYYKTSNGFDSSGERQHDCLFDVFLDMDLSPSKAIPNVWMKKAPGEKSSEGICNNFTLKNDGFIINCLRRFYTPIQKMFSANIGNSPHARRCSRPSSSSGMETITRMTKENNNPHSTNCGEWQNSHQQLGCGGIYNSSTDASILWHPMTFS